MCYTASTYGVSTFILNMFVVVIQAERVVEIFFDVLALHSSYSRWMIYGLLIVVREETETCTNTEMF